ncbi:hypothetical protein CYMTET_12865 [Cymbomonas tetramitiformis]|uniref:Pyruvate kinase n=1 Tax=Cymbomonas tetramitiformis TaxID=36881 RepID=A0AAE0GJQ7_9CHLO|nr:hypothetical protein CYMTET_12865 [Cymbomonas tetramitiformis]
METTRTVPRVPCSVSASTQLGKQLKPPPASLSRYARNVPVKVNGHTQVRGSLVQSSSERGQHVKAYNQILPVETLQMQSGDVDGIDFNQAKTPATNWMDDKNSEERVRKTKIVCTIGPSSWDRDSLYALADAGMNVARLNMSHGDHAQHLKVIKLLKELNATKTSESKIGILLDTKGPEVRSGDISAPVELLPGMPFTFTIDRSSPIKDANVTTVNYDGFIDDVNVGDILLVDGGMMSLRIDSKTDKSVACEVLEGGIMKSRRHLNIRGSTANLPSITEKDWEDLQFGVDNDVDFFALSFVHNADVIRQVKEFLKKNDARIAVLPKIESVNAVDNLEEILEISDGAMVARGDLGSELPVEEVPAIQSEIIYRCNQQGKPVIVATHMMESMIEHPCPTRAEIADITMAVREGTDAVMLSGETANGKYPTKAVEVMARTAARVPWELAPGPETQLNIPSRKLMRSKMSTQSLTGASNDAEKYQQVLSISETFAYNATCMANYQDVPLLVFSRSGFMPALLSHYRPKSLIYAFTNSEAVERRLTLYRGVVPLAMDLKGDREASISHALQVLKEKGEVKEGSYVCVVSSGHNAIWRDAATHGISFRLVE